MSRSRFLDPLIVRPMADGVQWALAARFRYYSERLDRTIEVPELFIVDFASSPRILWSRLPPWQRYGAIAVIHDRLYWTQETTREEADTVLRDGMELLAVPIEDIVAIHAGVRVGGSIAWDSNAEVKASGYSRMASPASSPPYASAI